MDLEPRIIEFLKERGPVTVKCISKRLGLTRNLVRGALWRSKHTHRTDRAPSCRRKKPIWSFSETREVAHLVLRPTLEEHEDEDH